MDSLIVKVTPERIRQIGSRGNIDHMSTVEAEAFMVLYREKLKDSLEETLKRFVTDKL